MSSCSLQQWVGLLQAGGLWPMPGYFLEQTTRERFPFWGSFHYSSFSGMSLTVLEIAMMSFSTAQYGKEAMFDRNFPKSNPHLYLAAATASILIYRKLNCSISICRSGCCPRGWHPPSPAIIESEWLLANEAFGVDAGWSITSDTRKIE